MGTYDLELTLHNIEEIIDMKKSGLRKNRLNLDIMLQLSMLNRQYACGTLLARYDSEGFSEHLTIAANIYNYYLDHTENDPLPDPYYLSRSKGEPFLDAVAANAFNLARDISAKMPSEWTENMEYEDDFVFFKMLSECINESIDEDQLNASLEAFEKALEGASSYRFDVMKAIVEKDANAFDEAFQELITERLDYVSGHRASNGTETIFSVTDANIFIEGIALLRIAKRFGLKIDNQYQLIPEATLQDFEEIKDDSFLLWD